jgi:hypothetical protein
MFFFFEEKINTLCREMVQKPLAEGTMDNVR